MSNPVKRSRWTAARTKPAEAVVPDPRTVADLIAKYRPFAIAKARADRAKATASAGSDGKARLKQALAAIARK
jgi:hypothetical protein